jgi:hypothetical protein
VLPIPDSGATVEYDVDESSTDASVNGAPKYRVFANNSLLVSALEEDDIRAYKCHVRTNPAVMSYDYGVGNIDRAAICT